MDFTRRSFLEKSALAGSFYIVPRHVLGKGFRAPSDQLNIAGVGINGKGMSDVNNAYNEGVNNIAALCDVDLTRAKPLFDKFAKAGRYQDWRVMLEKEKGIDAVTISTPDHNHAAIAMAAMQLGKHVYVQKPMAHNIFEVRTMTEAARKYKVVSQMGNQGASSPGTQQVVKWFEEGLIGKVHTVNIWTNRPIWPQGIPVPTGKHEKPADLDWDVWLGPASLIDYNPAYHPFKWRGWWNFGTGALGDMGCHLIDGPFRALGLGYPTEVEASVGSVFIAGNQPEYLPEGCPPSAAIQLKFPASKKNKSAVTMNWTDGGIRGFHPDLIPADDSIGTSDNSNGVIMMGSKGVLVHATYGLEPRIYLNNGTKIEMPKQEPNNLKEYGHQAMWAEACKAGFNSAAHESLASKFDFAGPLSETVLMGNLAIRSFNVRTPIANTNRFTYPGRKKLLWDGQNMKITNFEDANQFVKREYRAGWKL